MKMNITKTKGMIVSKKETVPEMNINIEGESIQQVKEMIILVLWLKKIENLRERSNDG